MRKVSSGRDFTVQFLQKPKLRRKKWRLQKPRRFHRDTIKLENDIFKTLSEIQPKDSICCRSVVDQYKNCDYIYSLDFSPYYLSITDEILVSLINTSCLNGVINLNLFGCNNFTSKSLHLLQKEIPDVRN